MRWTKPLGLVMAPSTSSSSNKRHDAAAGSSVEDHPARIGARPAIDGKPQQQKQPAG